MEEKVIEANWKDPKYPEIKVWIPKEKEKELKELIMKTYNAFYWIGIFLLLPTIGTYFIEWEVLVYMRDAGIAIYTICLWYINKRMKKKRKELEKNK